MNTLYTVLLLVGLCLTASYIGACLNAKQANRLVKLLNEERSLYLQRIGLIGCSVKLLRKSDTVKYKHLLPIENALQQVYETRNDVLSVKKERLQE